MTGWLAGIGAYVMWAFFPLYFRHLHPAGAVEVIAHRALWGLLACLAVLAFTRSLPTLRAAWRSPAVRYRLMAAGFLIAINWSVYVYSVLTDRVVDAALGYFINPLVTVGLAMLVLREKLTRMQAIALLLGIAAVVYMVISMGTLPWISIALAFSFGFYSLVKKRVSTGVTPVAGMVIETATITPFLLAYLVYLAAHHQTSFDRLTTTPWPAHLALLIGAGILTVVPLLMFAQASRTLPLGALGLLQYISPVGQLLIGVVVLGESMSLERWIGTGIVWVALVFLSADALLHTRHWRRRVRPEDPHQISR